MRVEHDLRATADRVGRAGVGARYLERLLAELESAGWIDLSQVAVDSFQVRARRGGEETGPNPVDRRKRVSKHLVLVGGGGAPLAATVTTGNSTDVKGLEPVVDALPTVRDKPGRTRRRGVGRVIPQRRTAHGGELVIDRQFSERTPSWPHGLGRPPLQ